MKVDILASGSSGNCIAVRSSQSTILVDVGIAKTKIEKRLLDVGIRPHSIKAVLITHAHADHTKGLPLANKYKIPVFAGRDEWKSIDGVENKWNIIAGNEFQVDDFIVKSFRTHHDAYDPVGYTLTDNEGKVSICLDTGHVDDEMIQAMSNSDIYIIESNHEPRMVEASDYPDSVKARILSENGHLSNQQTASALYRLVQGKGEKIILTHLSSKNNMPALAQMTVVKALSKKELKPGKHYEIEVV